MINIIIKDKCLNYNRVVLFAICLAIVISVLTLPSYSKILADENKNIPTVFVNDRPYGKYNIYPSEFYNNEFYVPLDIFTEFAQLSITQEANGGFLIENINTGSFISYSGNNDNAVIANNRKFSIIVLKRNNTNYIPAVFSCSIFSLSFETFTYKEEKMTRIKDSNATLDFPSLVKAYVPSEIPLPPSSPNVDFENESNIAITFESFGGEYVNEILQICSEYNLKSTFFFTSEELMVNSDIIRKVLIHGHNVGIYIDVGEEASKDDVEQMLKDSIDKFRNVLMYRPHLVRFSKNLPVDLRSSGEIEKLKKKYALTEANANVDSRDHIYSHSAVMEKLKMEMTESVISVIRFTSSSSTANSIRMLMDFINKDSSFSLFTINETTEFIF